jgi:hypothetical protein
VSERAHKWFWFTAVGSVTPILIFAIILLTRGKWAGFPYLIERGELFLISAVLLAASIGDLFTADLKIKSAKKMRHTKMFILGISLALGLVSAVWYAIILDCLLADPPQKYNALLAANCSSAIFASTLLMSLACVMLSTESES